jgi:hypothetical protein
MAAPTEPQSNRVTALFRDATLLAFNLDPEMSLGELAVRIGSAARPHGGLLLPVYVQLAAGQRCGKTKTLGANLGQGI